MTIFNPLDPNNGSTFKFLAMNQSKPILQRLGTVKSIKSKGNAVEES